MADYLLLVELLDAIFGLNENLLPMVGLGAGGEYAEVLAALVLLHPLDVLHVELLPQGEDLLLALEEGVLEGVLEHLVK